MRNNQRRRKSTAIQTRDIRNQTELEISFRKEEYNSLRKEVENTLSEISNVERNCLLAVAAIYAWIFSDKTVNEFDNLIWFMPPLITALSILRTIALNKHISLLAKYLLQVEQYYLKGSSQGWESFFDQNGRGDQTKIRIVYWGIFLTITFTAFCLHYIKRYPGN